MAINLRHGAWVKVARTLAASANLVISYVSDSEIEKMGAQAWTDGRSLFLRKPDTSWDDQQFKLWLYSLLHEIGHCRDARAGCWDVLKENQPQGLLAYVSNLLEDYVQELDMCAAEPSLRGHLSQGRAAFYDFLLAQSVSEEERRELLANPKAPALFSWDALIRQSFMPGLEGYAYQLVKLVADDPRVKEWQQKLADGDYITVLRDRPNPAETYDLAVRIVREVFGEEPESRKQNEAGSSGQGDGDGETESDGADPTDDGARQDAEKGEGKGKGGGLVVYGAELPHRHGKDEEGGAMTVSYDEHFAGERSPSMKPFVPEEQHNHIVCDMGRGASPPTNLLYSEPTAMIPPPSNLSKRIARHLQAQSRNRKLYAQKSGKLSNKSLYRLKIKGAGDQRQRVFHKRILNKSTDVAVTLAVDASGSMQSYGKAQVAVDSITHLHECISRQLRIPLEILAFTEQRRPVPHGVHIVLQSFDKPRRTEDVLQDAMTAIPCRGRNRDGEFLMWAHDRLLARKAARHIMIVISDGSPLTCEMTDVATFTKEVAGSIEREGRVELYAIGLMTESVHHFYKHHTVITEVSRLEEALLTVLKDKILNTGV